VMKLAGRLRREQFEPWLCETSIETGANWVEEIEKGLAATDLALLVWSPDAAASFATHMEIYAILAREIAEKRLRLAVVLLHDCALPELLRPRQYIDARRDSENAIDAVIDWLKGRREVGRFAGGRAPVYLPDYRPKDFVGRSNYLEELHNTFAHEPAIFLLYGEPGAGKSMLALEFAWDVQKDFDAVVFQACGQRSLDTITSELADRLQIDVKTKSPSQQRDAAKAWLRQRSSLLVLDDVWSVEVRQLEPGPACSVLYTSRLQSLAGIPTRQSSKIASFTERECEELFHATLDAVFGVEEVTRHREALLGFVRRVEMLPIAVAVSASLLREKAARRLDRGVSRLRPEALTDGVTDVPGLFRKAMASQPDREQRLLAACGVCAQEGFWLPLVAEIAGISEVDAEDAADRLVHSSLLRPSGREQRRFQLHALERESVRAQGGDSGLRELRRRHAIALECLFRDGEKRWRDCRECLAEIIHAVDFLWASDEGDRQWNLSNWGYAVAHRIGDLETALRTARQQESFWAERHDAEAEYYLQASYGNQAVILQAWGRLNEALDLLKKQEAICVELTTGDNLQANRGHDSVVRHSLQVCYGNQAAILKGWGRLEEALALYKKGETICLDLGNKGGLATNYGNQSEILKDWGRLDEAMVLLKVQEAIRLELGDKQGLESCYGRQGIILYSWGRLDEALNLYQRGEAIAIELGDKDALSRSYGNQAVIMKDWGRLEDALAFHKKEQVICLELGDKQGLQVCFGNQGLILRDQGRSEEALELHKKEESICSELGEKYGLQRSLCNQSLILSDWGRLDEAMAILNRQEAICLELGNRDSLQACYGNQALILKDWGRLDEAMVLLKKSAAICVELGKKRGLATNYGSQAIILQEWGRLDEAMVLLKSQEIMDLEMDNKSGLAINYGNQAAFLMTIGQLDEALTLLKQQEEICLGLGIKKPLGYCYWNWGRIAQVQGNRKVAKKKLEAARALFNELKMRNERDTVQGYLDEIASSPF
jgi:tetratricopeptide (TPR) repeat protein